MDSMLTSCIHSWIAANKHRMVVAVLRKNKIELNDIMNDTIEIRVPPTAAIFSRHAISREEHPNHKCSNQAALLLKMATAYIIWSVAMHMERKGKESLMRINPYKMDNS